MRESKLGCRPRRWSVILRFAHWTRAKILGTPRCESRKRFRGAPPHVQIRVMLLETTFRKQILHDVDERSFFQNDTGKAQMLTPTTVTRTTRCAFRDTRINARRGDHDANG